MDTMVVTGGAGFIGSNFVRHALVSTDARIVIVDKLTYAGSLASLADVIENPRVVFLRADIADSEAMEKLHEEYQPTSIINFAAESHVDRSIDGPRTFIQTNIVGAFELLDAARKYLKGVGTSIASRFRFLHVSTDEVYGTLGATGHFTETTPYAPNSPYSASKASADHLVRAYHETYGVPALITNCSNNYGPYQFPEKLIPLIILNALDAKPLPIYGDGGNIRDWLHVEDHCSGILLALQKGKPGEKYNIGGSNERTNLQVVDRVCSLLEQCAPAKNNHALLAKGVASYEGLKTYVKDRPGHDRRYAIDSTKIQRDLGWKPRFGFELGMEKTVRWYLGHRKWCEEVQAGKYSRERLGLEVERGKA